MNSRKLFSIAKKIELKLALAQETQEQVIEAPMKEVTENSGIFLYDKPKSWTPQKVVEFQKLINAWGHSVGYKSNLVKENGKWTDANDDEMRNILYGLKQNQDLPQAQLQSPEKMFEWLKGQQLLSKVPSTFGLKDKNMNPMSKEDVSKVQEWLKNMNRYSGPVDGNWNSSAQSALAKLQLDNDVSGNTAGDVLDTASQNAIGL